jgi:hypothetical protein
MNKVFVGDQTSRVYLKIQDGEINGAGAQLSHLLQHIQQPGFVHQHPHLRPRYQLT